MKVTIKCATDSFKRSWGRVRKPIIQLASAITGEELIYAFGVLGIVGPLDTRNSGWMVTDFAAWMFLISHMKGYHCDRAIWQTIRLIKHLFPGDFVVFGEAGCDRLQLPLTTLNTDVQDPNIPACEFTVLCLFSLESMAEKVKRHDKLVLLLIGHGSNDGGVFRFNITTATGKVTGEAFFTKLQLERALVNCRGDILVICNSCHSGGLMSEHWTLLCSAGLHQQSDALTQSGSGHFRGSAFTACVVAQAASQYGLRVPLPRTDPRPSGDHRVRLPPSPPSHSFPTSATAQVSTLKPLDMSFAEFMDHVENMQRFLVENSLSIFKAKGSKSRVSWNIVLPIYFTAEAVDQISVKATSANWSSNYNDIFLDLDLGGGLQGCLQASPFLTPQDLRFDPLLVKLLAAKPDIRPVPFKHDAIVAQTIADLQQHIAEPEQYAFPPQLEAGKVDQDDLLLMLRSVHVQAITVQLIARELGWYNAVKVTPFLPHQIEDFLYEEMINKGFRLNILAGYLNGCHFEGYRYVQFFNSWLLTGLFCSG